MNKLYYVYVVEHYFKKEYEQLCVGVGFSMEGAQEIIRCCKPYYRLMHFDIDARTRDGLHERKTSVDS